MMKTGFYWSTTNTTDNRMLYLTVMRDLKDYCRRGYCDIQICLSRFLVMPQSLLIRLLKTTPAAFKKDHIIVDWADYGSVKAFLDCFFMIITHVTHAQIVRDDYEKAFKEFTQHLKTS